MTRTVAQVWWLWALALLASVGVPARAQILVPAQPERDAATPFNPAPPPERTAPPETDAWLAERIAALGAPALAARDAASRALMQSPGLTIDRLIGKLDAPGLGAEQRARLEAAALGRFLRTPRGAMGIRFAGGLRQVFAEPEDEQAPGVEVGTPVPGWDSARALKAGDRLLTIAGVPLRRSTDAQSVILSHDPGDRVLVTLLRERRRLTVGVVLGRFGDLNSTAAGEESVLRYAWRERVRRVAGSDPREYRGAVIAGVELNSRALAAVQDRVAFAQQQAEHDAPAADPFAALMGNRDGVAVEGARPELIPLPGSDFWQTPGAGAPGRIVAAGTPRPLSEWAFRNLREDMLTRDGRLGLQDMQERLAQVQFEHAQVVERIIETLAIMNDPKRPQAERQAAGQRVVMLNQRLRELVDTQSRLEMLLPAGARLSLPGEEPAE